MRDVKDSRERIRNGPMILKMRCQHCSECLDVECEDTLSCKRRVAIAIEHGWFAFVVSHLHIPLFFCSAKCESIFKVQNKMHLTVVGVVNR